MPLIVTDPAASTNLTTIEAALAELGLSGPADYPYIEDLIARASAAIVSWCGRSFADEGVRETLHQDGPSFLLVLSRWPVTAVTAITINGVSEPPDRIEIEEGGLLYRLDENGRRVAWPFARLVIDYRGGYVLPDDPDRTLPADVGRAALSLVKTWFHARGRNPLERRHDIDGIGEVEYFSAPRADLTPEAEALLSRYRNRVFA